MARSALKVLIAGGGIGGITTALALTQRGIDALLFEKAAAFREAGAGIQLSANATRVLRILGLDRALARVAVCPERRDYRTWDTGERLFWTPLGESVEAARAHQQRLDLVAADLESGGDLRKVVGSGREPELLRHRQEQLAPAGLVLRREERDVDVEAALALEIDLEQVGTAGGEHPHDAAAVLGVGHLLCQHRVDAAGEAAVAVAAATPPGGLIRGSECRVSPHRVSHHPIVNSPADRLS